MNKTIEILKEYGVNNYTIKNGRLTINGDLYLSSLKEAHKDFLKGVAINGFLSLNSLKEVHKDFLKKTTINGNLYLSSLTEVHKNFLKGVTINGLYLSSSIEVHKDFLKGVTINGYLYCNSLMMQEGYNKEIDFCYFDGILSKVHNVRKNGDYTYYKVHNGYVVQKGDTTAHGKTLRESYNDLQFKLNKDKLLEEYKSLDICKEFTHNELREIYKNITGSCNFGIDNFIKNNDISKR